MYRKEEIKNRTTMEDYLKDYQNVTGFLDYCEKCMGYEQIWSCPLYDFNPKAYEGKYKYFHIMGTKIIFNQTGEDTKNVAKEYINRICMKEKEILSEKVQALEKKYPGSVGLVTGSCHMCSRCTRSLDRGCRYSDEIRYFLESLGANIGMTTGDYLGTELQLMKQKLPEYYTLVNGLLTDNPDVEIREQLSSIGTCSCSE